MSSQWLTIIDVLKQEHGIECDAGLSEAEILGFENEFGIHFPEDLRSFLRFVLPVSDRFPDWRNGDRDELRSWIELPLEGILFDVEHNGFWLPGWGRRPETMFGARRIVSQLVANAPKLIPVYGHRMIPDRPVLAGNPVFSVHQTDIIYYGCDLRDYFIHEFFSNSQSGVWPIADSVRLIEFWDVESFATRWKLPPSTYDGSPKTTR